MRFFILIVAVSATLFCSCSGKVNSEESNHSIVEKDSLVSEVDTFYIGKTLFTILPSTKEEFEKLPNPATADTSEQKNLFKDSSFASRLGGTLILNCGKNETMVFKNNPAEGYEEYADYTYLGKLDDINQYLVLGSFHESFSYILLNPITGDTTYVCGEPVFSPDKKHFICGNTDLVARFVVNGFDYFEVDNKNVKFIGRRELNNWGPEKIKWLDNNSLLIERSVADSTQEDMTRTDYIKLMIK